MGGGASGINPVAPGDGMADIFGSFFRWLWQLLAVRADPFLHWLGDLVVLAAQQVWFWIFVIIVFIRWRGFDVRFIFDIIDKIKELKVGREGVTLVTRDQLSTPSPKDDESKIVESLESAAIPEAEQVPAALPERTEGSKAEGFSFVPQEIEVAPWESTKANIDQWNKRISQSKNQDPHRLISTWIYWAEVFRTELDFERAYRTISNGQLKALQILEDGGLTDANLRTFYEMDHPKSASLGALGALASETLFYLWKEFLEKNEFIQTEERGALAVRVNVLTPRGRDFLKYIAKSKLPLSKNA